MQVLLCLPPAPRHAPSQGLEESAPLTKGPGERNRGNNRLNSETRKCEKIYGTSTRAWAFVVVLVNLEVAYALRPTQVELREIWQVGQQLVQASTKGSTA